MHLVLLCQISFWKIKAPSKVNASVWATVLGGCVLEVQTSQTKKHLFLHFEVAWQVWNRLFGICSESWVCPVDLQGFSHKVQMFREEKNANWQDCSVFG